MTYYISKDAKFDADHFLHKNYSPKMITTKVTSNFIKSGGQVGNLYLQEKSNIACNQMRYSMLLGSIHRHRHITGCKPSLTSCIYTVHCTTFYICMTLALGMKVRLAQLSSIQVLIRFPFRLVSIHMLQNPKS